MGIKNLLIVTKSIAEDKSLEDYRNKRVAIDGFIWLHKALHMITKNMGSSQRVSNYVNYFKWKLDKLISLNIKITIVWDGDKLPLKNKVNQTRYKERKKNYERAMLLYKQGDKKNALILFNRSISVTPNLVREIQENLKEFYKNEIKFIVAPYEADAQLAYLSRENLVDFLITEDSDLLVFGAKKVLFKLNGKFQGKEIKLRNLKKTEEIDISK